MIILESQYKESVADFIQTAVLSDIVDFAEYASNDGKESLQHLDCIVDVYTILRKINATKIDEDNLDDTDIEVTKEEALAFYMLVDAEFFYSIRKDVTIDSIQWAYNVLTFWNICKQCADNMSAEN